MRIKRKDHIRDILVNHGIYQFKNSLNLVKLKSKFILTIELGLEKKAQSMVAQLLNKKWRAGGLVDVRAAVASARGYDARAVRALGGLTCLS